MVLPEVGGPRPHTGLSPSPQLPGSLVMGPLLGLAGRLQHAE